MNKPFARNQKPEMNRIAQPFSLQAEEAVVGALLTDPIDTYAKIGDQLTEYHFYDPFCRATFVKAMDMLGRGETPDGVTLSAGLEAIVDLTQDEIFERFTRTIDAYPSSANLPNWTKVILAKSLERNMSSMGERLMEIAHAQDVSPDEKMAEANRLLSSMGSAMATDTMVHATSMVNQTMMMIEENSLKGGGITGVTTGFSELDKLTSGLQGGDLIVIAARPSMGKTSLVLSTAEAIAADVDKSKRKGVVLFSLEMGTTQIGMRWLSLREDVPLSHMRSGKVTPEEWKRLNNALEDSPDTPFFLEESTGLSVQQIAAKARRLHREHKLSLLVIDYLQLIEVGATKTRSEGVAEVSRALKMLAKELEIPIIALSQLNRTLEQRQDKRPIMSDLRESGAIEQDADVIIFIYRDEVYNPNTTDKGMAELIIAKQRNGGLGTVRLAFDAPTTRFRDGQSRFANDYNPATLRNVTGER